MGSFDRVTPFLAVWAMGVGASDARDVPGAKWRAEAMHRTIGLKIFGLVLLLSVLAAAVAWINERQADNIQNLVGNINKTYVPIYAALSDAQANPSKKRSMCGGCCWGSPRRRKVRQISQGSSPRRMKEPSKSVDSSRWRAISLLKR